MRPIPLPTMGNTAQRPLADASERPRRRRSGPLPLRVGGVEVLLLAAEVDLLLDAVALLRTTVEDAARKAGRPQPQDVDDALAELAELLHSSARTLADEPFEPTADQRRLLNQALADLVGYHRVDLPGGLRTLREHLR